MVLQVIEVYATSARFFELLEQAMVEESALMLP